MKRLIIFLVFYSLSSVFGQDKRSNSSHSIPLFTVGKHPVMTDEFIYLYQKNHQHKPEDFTKPKIEEYLDLYINFKLKVAEAKAQGLDTTQTFQQEFDQYREEIKKPFVSEGDDLDRLVKEAYQRSTEQVRAAHILIMVNPSANPDDTLKAWNKIQGLRKRAANGEDFGQLAKEFSEDPSAKSNGGDLSYFSAFDMVYPFESAAYNTKVGDISPIIKTRYGYHIIKVIDHRPASGEVEVSHIMILTGKGDDAKARNSIFEVHDQLKAGGKWDELCKQYSEDPNTKNNGGRLRPFKMGTFTIAAPSFEIAAFSLNNPGDISDPIQTPFGWHIIRLENKVPVPQFKEIQGTLTRRVSANERMQFSKAARISEMKKELGFHEHAKSKNNIIQLADSALNNGQWRGPIVTPAVTLCEIGDKKFGENQFIRFVERNQTKNNFAPAVYMEQLYNQWIEHLLNTAEEEKLIRDKPEFKTMLDEYREGILLFTIMETEVWNKASADSLGQKKFYDENLSRYQADERIHARIFSTDDRKIMEGLKEQMTRGDTLTSQDLRKLKSVSNFRSYEKGESKVTDIIPWTIGIHETQIDDVYYLCEVDKLVPAGVKTFDEARASIISDYQDSLEKEWIAVLKKKYPVSVNTKGKKSVIKELTAKK